MKRQRGEGEVYRGVIPMIAPTLNLTQVPVKQPRYRYHKIYRNETAASIVLNQTSVDRSTFKLPPLVYNMKRSFMTYKVAVAVTENKSDYRIIRKDVHGLLQGVDLKMTNGSNYLVNLPQGLPRYSKMMVPISRSYEDGATGDVPNFAASTGATGIGTAAAGAVYPFVGSCPNGNPLYNVPVALGAITDATRVTRPDGSFYSSPNELLQATRESISDTVPDASTAVTMYATWNFWQAPKTMLDHPVDVYIPSEMELGINWGPTLMFTYYTTGVSSAVGTRTSNATVTVTDVVLWMAVQDDQDAAIQVQQECLAKPWLNISFPVMSMPLGAASTDQSVTGTWNRNYGDKLRQVVWSAFTTSTLLGTGLDNANTKVASNVATGVPKNIVSFNTSLNSKQLQDGPVRCDRIYNEDYRMLGQFFTGRQIISREGFEQNWLWIDNFESGIDANGALSSAQISGLELYDANTVYGITTIMDSAVARTFVMIAVFNRKLAMQPPYQFLV